VIEWADDHRELATPEFIELAQVAVVRVEAPSSSCARSGLRVKRTMPGSGTSGRLPSAIFADDSRRADCAVAARLSWGEPA
jgi:hypothetical protein